METLSIIAKALSAWLAVSLAVGICVGRLLRRRTS